jgi:hypothetical protein
VLPARGTGVFMAAHVAKRLACLIPCLHPPIGR